MLFLKCCSKLLILISLISLSSNILAQEDFVFQPGSTSHSNQQSLIADIEAKFEFDKSNLPKNIGSQVIALYLDRKDGVIKRLADGHFLFDETIYPKVQSIFSEIVEANPHLPKEDLRLFLTRYSYPNAASVGEGTFEFNLGLLKHLKNESQIAFVIAHEIAHYYLDHANHAIQSHYSYLNSKEGSKELKRIKKTKYGKETEKMDFLKDLVFDHRRHSRYNESAADSLAVVLLENTSFKTEASLSTLKILDKVDDAHQIDTFNLKKVFAVEGLDFKDSWLKIEHLDFEYQKINIWDEDSLKTHPDIDLRIATLEQEFNLNVPEEIYDKDLAKFFKLTEFEIIEGAIELGNYASAIFLAIDLMDKYPDDPYLKSALGQNLLWIYQARKEHVLSDHVPMPDPSYSYNYNLILNFIHNLRYSETKNLAIAYLEAHSKNTFQNEEGLFTLIMASFYSEDISTFNARVKTYQLKFPEGRYLDFIDDLELNK